MRIDSMTHNLIGFSHHYTKLQNQTSGTLVWTDIVHVGVSNPAPAYDTEWLEREYLDNGDSFLFPHYYGLNEDDYALLVFLGNNNIPFTTFRSLSAPQAFGPFYRDPYSLLVPSRNDMPYNELIGESFFFKFKGEPTPKEYTKNGNSVEIYD